MLAKILGILWIGLGLLWLLKPAALKNRLQRKMNRKMRFVVYGFILVFGFLMIGSVIKTPGLLSKAIGVIGMIVAIRAIMLITSKTSEKVFEWWGNRPLGFYRIWALCMLIIGGMMIYA